MSRLEQEDGFGLIELLMAMVMLNIGILAMVASFNSGIVALARSSHISTAAALADQQMELYRGLPYGCIYLSAAGTSSNWTGDTTFNQGTTVTTPQPSGATCSPVPPTNATTAFRALTGPDHHKYEIDTYVILCTPGAAPCNTSSSSRAELRVSIGVHDGQTSRVLARVQSTFDAATGS